MQDWKEQQVLREEQVTRLQALVQVQEHRKEQRAVPDAVLEVYLEHLLIMKKDELRVNSPVSHLYTTLPPENQER